MRLKEGSNVLGVYVELNVNTGSEFAVCTTYV